MKIMSGVSGMVIAGMAWKNLVSTHFIPDFNIRAIMKGKQDVNPSW